MFAVEIYAAVRRFVFVEGKSRREAARVFGLSRDTIARTVTLLADMIERNRSAFVVNVEPSPRTAPE